jgi:hypothetical protein
MGSKKVYILRGRGDSGRATKLEAGASVFNLGPRDLSTDSSARLLIMFTVIVKMCVETGACGVGGTPAAGGGDTQRRRLTGRHSNRTAE